MDTQNKLTVAKDLFNESDFLEYEKLLADSDAGKLKATKRTRFSELSFQVKKHADKLNSSTANASIQSGPANRTSLDDGTVIEWFSELIPADSVQDSTFVLESNNGRSQSLLTEFSLSLMTHTIRKNCQFYPAYGVRHKDGRIEIIDGSRRRMSCVFGGTDFSVYVTNTSLTPEQIKSLRVILQSAREAALYDVGMDCIALKNQGLNGKDIAKFLNISESKVSRAKLAAQAPLVFLKLFDDYSVLSLADYKQLVDIKNVLVESKGENVINEDSDFLGHVGQAL
uniref:ParB N-terminal domain-containing protein n=1 Tax=Candidatus Enterovibrio escicola TaxID=1927127 RepID=UPI00123806CC